MTHLAIYDMDRTITVRGTYTPFLFHMVFARAPWRLLFLPLLPFGFIGYGLKLISRKSLKTYNQRLLLGSRPKIADLQPHIEDYADKVIRSNSYANALAQVESDRAEGRKLILATASYELYVNAIAARLNFDAVIATRLKIDEQDRVLPQIVGENCYDIAKLDRIKTYLDAQELDPDSIHIRAYSDHVSDAPMLEYADEAIATTPSGALRALAKKRNWQIVDWDQ
ncbi:MAG: HAD family hydrolase [Parasphingorhabdus sp.]|uniref:HAD family hydrolase n=1 Tax=Parasphingorhabdus sp. TaxID=2709688 RepID=UPI003298305B